MKEHHVTASCKSGSRLGRLAALGASIVALVGSLIVVSGRMPTANAAPTAIFPETATFSLGFAYQSDWLNSHIFTIDGYTPTGDHTMLYGYCMDPNIGGDEFEGPCGADGGGNKYVFTRKELMKGSQEKSAYGWIIAHGFPVTNEMFGQTFSDREAAEITQEAIWMVKKGLQTGFSTYAQQLYQLAWSWAADPNNYNDDTALANNICYWYQPPAGHSDMQRVLVAASSGYGEIAVKKESDGTVTIRESSTNKYSLGGAEYTLYTDPACDPAHVAYYRNSNNAAVFTVREDGTPNVIHTIAAGNYWLKETKAPAGNRRDKTAYPVTIVAEAARKVVTMKDTPIYGRIKVVKKDASTGELIQKSGFKFSLFEKGGTSPIDTGTTGDDGTVLFSEKLSLGTYEVLETECPSGWTVDTNRHEVTISASGNEGAISGATEADTTNGPNNIVHIEISDQPSDNEQLHASGEILVKKTLSGGDWTDETSFNFTLSAAAGAPVPSKTALTITAADADNNYTKSFGEISFSKAGTFVYTVSEEHKGQTVGGIEYDPSDKTITIKVKEENGELVADTGSNLIQTATFSNAYKEDIPDEPEIRTRFTDIEGSSNVSSGSTNVRVVDHVSYENLIPNKEYELRGSVHIRKDGKDVGTVTGGTATKTFTPKQASGTETIEFTIDLSDFTGDAIVAFESLRQNNVEVAIHTDITDEDQTIVPKTPDKPNVSIGTKLATASGDKDAIVGMEVSSINLIDTVSYAGLTPGKKYSLQGELHTKSANGQDAGTIGGATGNITFIPDKADGTVDVPIKLDLTKLVGTDVVAFETLSLDGSVVAEHKDITDSEQTVKFHRPSIGTILMTADGKKTLPVGAKGKVTLTDTVEYKGLVPGKEYELRGEIHSRNAQNGDGGIMSGSATKVTFVPKTSDGKAEVKMTVDVTNLATPIVAFEELHLKVKDEATGTDTSQKIAEHKDITDQGQTVTLPRNTAPASDLVTTGLDETALGVLAVVIVGVLGYALFRIRARHA